MSVAAEGLREGAITTPLPQRDLRHEGASLGFRLTLPAQIAYQCRLILLDGQERGVRQDRTRQITPAGLAS